MSAERLPEAAKVLRDEIAAHLSTVNWSNASTRMDRARFWRERADAVLAVVGPELDRLRAGNEAVSLAFNGLSAVAEARRQARDAAEAERDDLRARLADVWDEGYDAGAVDERNHADCTPNPYRAVLASVPEPSDSEPRSEAFVELLPPDVGHNLWHFGPERAHVTGDACHCRPRPIPHEPAPDVDREAGEW